MRLSLVVALLLALAPSAVLAAQTVDSHAEVAAALFAASATQAAVEKADDAKIAAELSVSRRTIDHHLRNTYGKLGVSSRRQLTSALPPGSPEHPGSR